ncbi:MAG: hypothetical protein LH628_10260 [Microcoleus sp. CAN_BIN18]|nr:hypothetical protein [Microcoleus sp. CAN_BIN18]
MKVAGTRIVRFLTDNSRINRLSIAILINSFAIDIWQAGRVEWYFSRSTNTITQTSPAGQISLVKNAFRERYFW